VKIEATNAWARAARLPQRQRATDAEPEQHQHGRRHRDAMPAHELAQRVQRRRRPGRQRLVAARPLDVRREVRGRQVAAAAVLLEGLEHDPVEIAAQPRGQRSRRRRARGGPRAGVGRLHHGPRARWRDPRVDDLARDDAGVEAVARDGVGPAAGQQLVQQHPQRVDVGASIDLERRQLRLLGAHVLGRAEQVADARVGVRVIGRCGRRLGDSEVDDLRNRAPVDLRDQDVRRLEVAVDHAAQVRELHARADLAEQREARRDVEPPLVAVACQGDAGHVLHREVRPAFRRRTRVEDPRDVRMGHQRQRLPLDLEACDDLARPEAELDHLQGNPPPDRRGLFGQEHLADRPLADALEDPVRPDGPRLQGTRQRQRGRIGVVRGEQPPHARGCGGVRMRREQRLARRAVARREAGLEQLLIRRRCPAVHHIRAVPLARRNCTPAIATPRVARYAGSGDTHEAANRRCEGR
jgi:hypothetical protein